MACISRVLHLFPLNPPMSDPADRLVLKITHNTVLKRRVAPASELGPDEKVSKGPCRIYLHSYAYDVPGEKLQGHLKVSFEQPFMGYHVWYVYGPHCCVEGKWYPTQTRSTGGQSRKINQAGLELVKQFEGLRLSAYICPAGVPTIGYGSTKGVKMGDCITKAEAEALLIQDLERFEKAVNKAVKVPLTANQFSALVCFAFNVGIGAFQDSTLLRVLNQSDYAAAANELLRWNKGGGKVLPGLTRRRQAERALFLT